MATLVQLEEALINAHRAGDTNAARKLAKVVFQERARREADPLIAQEELIPESLGGGAHTIQDADFIDRDVSKSSLGEKIVGVGETALTLGTGATAGSLGMVANTLKALANEITSGELGTPEGARRVMEAAQSGMEALTYAPRTEAGQEILQDVGDVATQIGPIPQLQALGGASRAGAAASVKGLAHEKLVQPLISAKERIKEAGGKPIEVLKKITGFETEAPTSVGDAAARQARAEGLRVPVELTKGQKTRDIAQLGEETRAAQHPRATDIREASLEQSAKLQQNLDSFLDATGAKALTKEDIGVSVSKSLEARAAKDKNKIHVLYKKAEQAGEMEAPVTLKRLAAHLEENIPEAETANILKVAQKKAIQLKAIDIGPNGEIVPLPISLKDAETLRQSITGSTNIERPNIRQSSIMKGLIDGDTEAHGGDVYRSARRARAKYGRDFEDISLIKKLVGKKRGGSERAIALENVLDKSILSASTPLSSVKQLRKLLQTEGPEGLQAWKDLQGGVIRHLQDEMLKGVKKDPAGNAIISPANFNTAINKLDSSGKLDLIFTPKHAKEIRVLNEVVQDVITKPVGPAIVSPLGLVKQVVDRMILSPLRYSLPVATVLRLFKGLITKGEGERLMNKVRKQSKNQKIKEKSTLPDSDDIPSPLPDSDDIPPSTKPRVRVRPTKPRVRVRPTKPRVRVGG